MDLASLLPADADRTLLAGYIAQRDLTLAQYRSPRETVQEVAFGGTGTFPVVVIKPLSRGSILINSTDPFAPPVIDYGTFRHRTDLDIAVASLKKVRQYFASEPFQELGINEVFPGPAVTGDEALAEAIRGFATSTWSHPVGTLSMMKREYGGVVDPLLRVYGVRNLRVVDASIMPMTPATHTSSTVYAIAEKVSERIGHSVRVSHYSASC